MALLPILHYPDERLHRVAAPVQVVNDQIRQLVRDMAETMYAAPGIGLAATQVDVHLQVVVIDVSETHDQLRVFINPQIVESRGTTECEEGCLSVPGVYETVTRAEWVELEAQDLEGGRVSLTARGLRARVFQHEMDHLDGVLFIDRLDPMTRDRIKRRIRKEGFAEDASGHRAAAL